MFLSAKQCAKHISDQSKKLEAGKNLFILGSKLYIFNQDLIALLLPEGLFEYFDVFKVEKIENSFIIHIVERNLIPKEFEGQKLESKGYFEKETVRDFPLRGKACFLKIERLKWLNHDSGKIVSIETGI